jgi:putative Holliday junction resolvase
MKMSNGLMSDTGTLLALDYGGARVGVALASLAARLPQPLITLANDAQLVDTLKELAKREEAVAFVVGLPRNLSGEDTEQTRIVRQFVDQLARCAIPVYLQDEAGTSQQAEAELRARRKPFAKGDIDALAACLILENYLREEIDR